MIKVLRYSVEIFTSESTSWSFYVDKKPSRRELSRTVLVFDDIEGNRLAFNRFEVKTVMVEREFVEMPL